MLRGYKVDSDYETWLWYYFILLNSVINISIAVCIYKRQEKSHDEKTEQYKTSMFWLGVPYVF